MSLAPLAKFLTRTRQAPSQADFFAAGMLSEGGSVTRGIDFIGLSEDFGITSQAYDKKTGKLMSGRFLIQYDSLAGEVLHHIFSVDS